MSINTLDIKEVKENYYNMILKEPLKGCENSNIQYIIEVTENNITRRGIASLKPLTSKDIEQIDFDKWEFKKLKEWEEIWKKNKNCQKN